MTDQSNDNELDLFLKEMKGVKPLKTKTRVVSIQRPDFAEPGIEQRRKNAEHQVQHVENALNVDHLDMVHPLDVLTFKRTGLAPGVFRRLKQGKYTVDAKLDLHRKRVEEARREVFQFVKDCLQYDIRCAMILHGKGERGDPPALLKSYTNRWLKEIPEVLAFHSAQPNQGGVGAVYVLIKKSERKKQLTREKYHR